MHDPEGKRHTRSAPYDSNGEIGSKLVVYLKMPAQEAEPSCGVTDGIVMDVRHRRILVAKDVAAGGSRGPGGGAKAFKRLRRHRPILPEARL